jgi:hypothetical protein
MVSNVLRTFVAVKSLRYGAQSDAGAAIAAAAAAEQDLLKTTSAALSSHAVSMHVPTVSPPPASVPVSVVPTDDSASAIGQSLSVAALAPSVVDAANVTRVFNEATGPLNVHVNTWNALHVRLGNNTSLRSNGTAPSPSSPPQTD